MIIHYESLLVSVTYSTRSIAVDEVIAGLGVELSVGTVVASESTASIDLSLSARKITGKDTP